MAYKLGIEALGRPQVIRTLLALLCFGTPAALTAQAAVDRSNAAALASYVVQAGDILSLSIYGWPSPTDKLEGRFPVEADGRAHLPVVGAVEVAGKTTERVQAELRQRLSAEQRQAIILIEPLFAVSINGEVQTPNVYDFRPGQTVFDALSRAGGYTEDADRSNLLLVRDGKSQTLSAGSANELAAMLAQMRLESGDRLMISPSKGFKLSTVLGVLQVALGLTTLYALVK